MVTGQATQTFSWGACCFPLIKTGHGSRCTFVTKIVWHADKPQPCSVRAELSLHRRQRDEVAEDTVSEVLDPQSLCAKQRMQPQEATRPWASSGPGKGTMYTGPHGPGSTGTPPEVAFRPCRAAGRGGKKRNVHDPSFSRVLGGWRAEDPAVGTCGLCTVTGSPWGGGA